MALLDLALVTETLVNVVRETILSSPAWPSGQTAEVCALPPDKLSGHNSLGIYLYHLAEEAALKNQVWADRPAAPIRYLPMGVNLFYVVSAKSDLSEDGSPNLGPFREQLMMGLAIKALHDNPIVDDQTIVGGAPAMPSAMRGAENKLRLELRHVPPNEAVSFWTAGSNPLRLSAYYEARVVLLEPDEPPIAGGRVLVYNVASLVSGLPQLATSRSTLTFTVPGEAAPRSVEAQPAQCAPDTELVLIGVNLAGDRVSLSIRGAGWPEPVDADASWGVVASADRVFATVRATVGSVPVLPGIYSAAISVARSFPTPDGGTREVVQTSNQTPFLVTPGVTAVSAVATTGVFTVSGGTFQHAQLPADAVRVYVAGARLSAGTGGALNLGEYAVLNAQAVEMRLPSGLTSGQQVPLRLLINGVESPPRWVKVP